MTQIDVLALHGSPGAGKSTLSRALSERLRTSEVPRAVIDMDELGLVFPPPSRSFARSNLRAIWPNYAAVPGIKVIVPTVVADADELAELRACVPGGTVIVCELTAPVAVLKSRVAARESNVFWRDRLTRWVDVYHRRTDLAGIRDFEVSTHNRSEDDAALEVITKVGWLGTPRSHHLGPGASGALRRFAG